ncbi:citrate/2-methylcitrate synthase [Tengunoibacter tsumagoiensis]|uniref:Citrate synthase n=1 Tax=Tengunoibacter tsumagoiensis TaxID=2014871 RepID=A0A401ZTZ0_9CHLR|nr:citrate/2-methylcitrate synthase [Tengunoibacter tsumagoiensis]GCE10240.1 citrate synthase [Tengunoibacter tsumagoiensis]
MAEIARGLRNVVLTETRLSMIDGEVGKLIIAGFPLEELAPHATFEEVLYLLWHDRLPNADELTTFTQQLSANRSLPETTLTVLQVAAQNKLPLMDALRMGVDTLSLVDPEPEATSIEANLRRASRLLAHFPTIVASYWRLLHGQEPVTPRSDLSHAANFLYMVNGQVPEPAITRGMETYLNTVVDHGMNASTFTARVIASTRSDMTSAIVGAIGSLKGPLHGGAPGPAADMVFEIRERAARSGRSVAEEAKDWATAKLQSKERIMGFGHRVYRVRDPRADVLGGAVRQLFQQTGGLDFYNDARAVEDAMLQALEEYKPGLRIKTNVEFYTALILHGIGLEPEIFSPVFAISRVGGWVAHILEQYAEDELIRPTTNYNGAYDRKWVPLAER